VNEPITTEETYHVSNILKHYAHAKEKHPYFCDWIKPDAADCDDVRRVTNGLAYTRKRVSDAIDCHNVGWDDLLDCEVWEVFDALVSGDTAHAIEELYDCIAVCLRTIDALKGWQKLGRPETKGEAK
jgi:hypothetical protein